MRIVYTRCTGLNSSNLRIRKRRPCRLQGKTFRKYAASSTRPKTPERAALGEDRLRLVIRSIAVGKCYVRDGGGSGQSSACRRPTEPGDDRSLHARLLPTYNSTNGTKVRRFLADNVVLVSQQGEIRVSKPI